MSINAVTIQLTEDFVLLPDAVRAAARQRREERTRGTQDSRSRSRGRAGGTLSPFRDSRRPASPARASSSARSPSQSAATPRATSPERGRREGTPEVEAPLPNAFIRGLLTLTLAKPTKIRKINLRLKGTARTDWPEGIGPRPVEICEEVQVFRKFFPVFSASPDAPTLRRSNSVETLDLRHGERMSRRDQHLQAIGTRTVRAASVLPGRDPSSDRLGGSYIASRDARDPPQWQDPPPPFSEGLRASQRGRTQMGLDPGHNARPPLSRHSTSHEASTLRTNIAEEDSPLQTPSREDENVDYHSGLEGAASAPVSSTARSSLDNASPSRERDVTPPTTRPHYQSAASAQRSGSQKRDASQTRFSLTSLLRSKERGESLNREGRSRSRGRQMNLKALRDVLTATVDATPRSPAESEEDDEASTTNWREFKAGRYVWPIQVPVPVTLPPTLNATFGSIKYTLKATVVRPGALTPNIVSETRVELVSSLGEDDTEDTDTIVIERLWDLQMRYLVTLSGKAFPIGSHIPLSIRLNPMAKIKLHRITASVEESTAYYAHGRRIARHEGIKRFVLAKAENAAVPGENPVALLPIMSDDVGVLLDSPLAKWVINATADDEHAPRLLDPIGPWELESNLPLPQCSSRIHFSIKHPKSPVEVSHVFKLVLRVERGDRDILDAKGNPKKFDIVIECPIVLLSCRNATNVLPPYSSNGPSAVPTLRSTEACGCAANVPPDALAHQQQFARLVAGAESPSGEVPPAYDPSPSRGSTSVHAAHSPSPHASPSRAPHLDRSPSSVGRGNDGGESPESRSTSRGRRGSVGRLTDRVRTLSRPPNAGL